MTAETVLFYSSVILNSTETYDSSVLSRTVFYSSVILNSTETSVPITLML